MGVDHWKCNHYFVLLMEPVPSIVLSTTSPSTLHFLARVKFTLACSSMSSHSQLHPRIYFDKAVQTEWSMASLPCETDSRGSLQSSRAVLSSKVADQAINELLSLSGGAYNQSKSTAMVSSLSGRSVNKSWLDYGRPSRGVQRRVVSHPDSVSCETKTLYENSGRLRVVSLPEPISLESRVSLASLQEGRIREYPSDIPRTPSPPSSPDSIIIVGNGSHLPSSFFQPHVDENGWATWANSPPRPIPALHGPSSLPYARCPSGAEGTVVEGDDLATKVWGLGLDEGHRFRSKSPRPLRPSASAALSPLDDNLDYQRVTSSAARHRDAVIKASTFDCHPEAYDYAGRHQASLDGTHSSPAQHLTRLNLYVTTQDIRSDNFATGCKELVSRRKALPQTSRPMTLSRHSNLNSTAPSFVPAYHTENTGSHFQHEAEFGGFENSHPANEPTVLCQQYVCDFTPSSTTSPLWSPVFQSVPIVLGDYDPRIYSSQTDLDACSVKQTSNQDFMSVQPHRAEQGVKSSIETFYAHSYVANNVVDVVSPEELRERRRHLSARQPRSVPMPRLVQRRLSSFIEIDINPKDKL